MSSVSSASVPLNPTQAAVDDSPSSWFVLRTAFGLALDSIRAHRLRSFLTLLGVIIGVASVVLVGAAVEGLGVSADKEISRSFGADAYLIDRIAVVGNISRKEIQEKIKRNKRPRAADVIFLRETTGDSVLYSPYRQRMANVKANNQTYEDASIIGAAASLPEIRDVALWEGRFFTDQEEQGRQPVCMIGQALRDQFFPGESPLGKTIKINGIDLTVIGMQDKLGSSFGNNLDGSVYIPITVFNRMFGPGDGFSVFSRARPDSGLDMERSVDQTRAALRTRFHAQPGQPDNFDILTPTAIRAFSSQILGMISAIVVPVTLISLVVGGIVIMNIMLVSVTERTREIGVRKSLGARSGDVLLQFLLEAVILSALGGVIGLALGTLTAHVLAQTFDLYLKVTMPYVLLALFVSSATGIISGWYPARRAAKLDPIAALRAE